MQNPIILILSYLVAYKLAASFSMRPAVSAGIVVAIPILYMIIIRLMLGADLQQLVHWTDILIAAIQFAIAFIVFYKLHYDDTATTALIWGSLGLLAIIFLPVMIAGLLLSF